MKYDTNSQRPNNLLGDRHIINYRVSNSMNQV